MRLSRPYPSPYPLADVLLWIAAAPLGYWLRLDDATGWLSSLLLYTLLGIPVKVALVYFTHLSRHLWVRVSVPEAIEVAQSTALGVVIMTLVSVVVDWSGVAVIPRSLPFIEGVLALLLLLGARVTLRYRHDTRRGRTAPRESRRVLVAGAGAAGTMIVREMLLHSEAGLTPVGFLDDNASKHGKRLMGLPVLGPLGDLPRLARVHDVDMVLSAMPSAEGAALRRVMNLAQDAGIAHRTVPGMYEILGGHVTINQIRDVNVEDLLQRPPVRLDHVHINAYLGGSTVLVTGAGGSIGSEIVRQVARFRPARIILFGRGENSIFQIQQELVRNFPEVDQVAIIGDVRHATHVRKVFQTYRPDVVVHAAAHKHVPLMEDSPSEAIFNNVMGTRVIAEMCLEFDVRRFVNISSDKAVNPTSVMGSSKRLAEMVIGSIASRAKPSQAFVSVRFGNVLGSRGSVIPTFMAQIRAGGPITVTHPEMVRYFMTIPEAARLVLQAGALAENGCVYVLNMGDPVKIVDLARDVIRLSGARDIDVVFTGIRPGEKLYEELLTKREHVDATTHEDIFIAHPEQPDPDWLRAQLALLEAHAREEDYPGIRTMLREMIPESLLKV